MDILFVVNNVQGKGGVERVLKDIANNLSLDSAYNITIISILSDRQNENIHTYNKDIKILHFNKKKIISKSFFAALKEEMFKKHYDYIVSCSSTITTVAFFVNILNKTKSKIIGWEHSQYNNTTKPKKIIRHIIYPFIYRVISQTNNDTTYYSKMLCKAQTIPNPLGIKIKEISNLKNRRCIAIGRLEKEKGFETLIKIVSDNKEKFNGWRIDIFGEGSLNGSLNAFIRELKLEEIISIHGFKSNISDEIVDSSILISTSFTESFSMVLVEGMACGVPVISFDCPSGPREIIDDGKNGFLIQNFNESEYMKKLSLLMENEELRTKIGQNGKNKSLSFDINKITNLWKELFENE